MNSTQSLNVNQETLLFDLEVACLQMTFNYELEAHRTRKRWAEILNNDFNLAQSDIEIFVEQKSGCWNLVCYFNSAAARYVFWKIINSQAPKTLRALKGLQPLQEDIKPAKKRVFQEFFLSLVG